MAYSVDSNWRNRSELVNGRREIVAFLTRKWNKELEYRLVKELWAFDGNRIALTSGAMTPVIGSDCTETRIGNSMNRVLMKKRFASINDLPINESERKFHWPLGRRLDNHPGLSDLGL